MGLQNASTYADPTIASYYERDAALQPAETAIFEKLRPLIAGGRILDLGVGTGRTVPHMLSISERYVGIDYSREMVSHCRRRFPGVDIRVGDARNLAEFDSESCHLVLFSFNGLDYVDDQDRFRVLSEIQRVLLPNGFFVFSSHNLAAFQRPTFPWTLHPLRLVKRVFEWLAIQPRRLRNRRHEFHSTEYSILNDSAHGYRLLTYYINVEHQIAQLRRAGFLGDVAVYDDAGQPTASDARSPWLYYSARKSAIVESANARAQRNNR